MAEAAYAMGAMLLGSLCFLFSRKHGAQKAQGPRDEGGRKHRGTESVGAPGSTGSKRVQGPRECGASKSVGSQKERPQKPVLNLGLCALWGTPLDIVMEV